MFKLILLNLFANYQKTHGVIHESVYQSTDNPNDITVIHDFNNIAEAKAFAAGKKPDSPNKAKDYCVRGGGAHTKSSLALEQVMEERFGSITGKVDYANY